MFDFECFVATAGCASVVDIIGFVVAVAALAVGGVGVADAYIVDVVVVEVADSLEAVGVGVGVLVPVETCMVVGEMQTLDDAAVEVPVVLPVVVLVVVALYPAKILELDAALYHP